VIPITITSVILVSCLITDWRNWEQSVFTLQVGLTTLLGKYQTHSLLNCLFVDVFTMKRGVCYYQFIYVLNILKCI
jgi:hypothetical protein